MRMKYKPEGSRNDVHSLFCGALNAAYVNELNDKLEQDPHHLETRLLLLGHYYREQHRLVGKESRKAADLYCEHSLWFIDFHPKHIIHDDITGFSDERHFPKMRTHWEKMAKLHSTDAIVMRHAARFFYIADPLFAAKLLKRAKKLAEGDDEIPDRLHRIYRQLCYDAPKSEEAKFAKLAFKNLKEAIRRYETYKTKRRRRLFTYKYDLSAKELANVAINCKLLPEARQLAELVLKRTDGQSIPRNYSKAQRFEVYGLMSAINNGNAILGSIALAEKKIPLALEHLSNIEVAEPYLHIESTFIDALLHKGQKDPALRYLEKIKDLYRRRKDEPEADNPAYMESRKANAKQMIKKLNSWIREIEKGHIPNIYGS